jgi:hypothetical protein
MTKFKIGDKVKIGTPENWPECTKFTLEGAEGTVGQWVDWPEAMDPYSRYIYVMIDKARGAGKVYEGVRMIFQEDTLKKFR